jgi:hypothetical protein
MAWFNFSRETFSDDQLKTVLFDSVAVGNAREINRLVRGHRERVAVLFLTWTTLPEDVRSDPLRTKWWAEGAIGVAKAAAALGDNSLMAQLLGPREENIIISWQNAFLAAEAEASSGNYASAIRLLEDMLERVKGVTGSGVDDLLPKTYGLLGTLYYRAGDATVARSYTVKAKEYCERIGDDEGVKTYTSNLRTIDAA